MIKLIFEGVISVNEKHFTLEIINDFNNNLYLEEKSTATIEKHIRMRCFVVPISIFQVKFLRKHAYKLLKLLFFFVNMI